MLYIQSYIYAFCIPVPKIVNSYMTNANIVLPNRILCLARFLAKFQFISYLCFKRRQGCAYIYILHHVSIITIHKRFENRASYFSAHILNFIVIYKFIQSHYFVNPPEVLKCQPSLAFHDSGQNDKWNSIKSIGRQGGIQTKHDKINKHHISFIAVSCSAL